MIHPPARNLITVQYSGPCLTCEAEIEQEEKAWWIPKVGIWHEDCPEPRNLSVYIAEANRKKSLGL